MKSTTRKVATPKRSPTRAAKSTRGASTMPGETAARPVTRRARTAPLDAREGAPGSDEPKGAANSVRGRQAAQSTRRRLPRTERQGLVLAKAAEYFAEHGLSAQTRAIAEACGVSQRLLYSLFPSKAALIEEVYNREIAGIFKAIWFVKLKDRSVPLEQRLIDFYRDYYESLLTRRWLRLFLFSSLAGLRMAPTYTDAIVTHALEIVVTEAAHDAGRDVPSKIDELTEIGWTLHGAISHLAIRRRIYSNDNSLPPEEVIALNVRAFLVAVPSLLPMPEAAG
ncbi:TetR/AcrR family transcriptional regulator [Paraburkholderia silvatlantica]|uniref:AcrR family transcriptional regulator n=1 Tax=Paraburkholderia silvatlantica TaxID=321895 RepID=A0ABR6FKX0_9BURK|nr:TetR/AcrR family transcriptional regulator [Paraburkholderia silvatlantica]MBB2928086.1 AcrR family transcriptional regulator [Paraburkholderia silvatlantica]PVY31051.1 TetR family transcriptional regulator [Paraburkholderia silvatlantica]PXW37187.1 TetR family transcriptional regulator [Paraburkholderia silvatlantica]